MEDLNSLSQEELDEYIKQNNIFAPEINPVFLDTWEAFVKNTHSNFQLYGGRGSSKSYMMRKMLEYLLRGYTGYNCRILLLRTTKESAKKSVFKGVIDVVTKDIGQRYESIHKADMARGTMEIKSRDLKNQSRKGLLHEVYVDSFSNDESTKEKLKGYTNISHVFIEELKELPTNEMYKQLLTSVMRPYTDKQTNQTSA
jgi:phage terminase large subunit